MMADFTTWLGGLTDAVQKSRQKAEFSCSVCGKECDFALDPPDHVVCPEHCEFHDFRYDEMFHQHLCYFCGEPAPDDWYFP